MDLATRQSRPSGFLPIASTPSLYFGQWLATHSGSRKLAEIGAQPRFAASVTPFECGATAVTTIGGWGLSWGVVMGPRPHSRVNLVFVGAFKKKPRPVFSPPLSPIFRTP